MAVLGAGCIGAWVGARIAATGTPVHLIGRDDLVDRLRDHGLMADALDGSQAAFFPGGGGTLTASVAADGVADARLVLVAVKGRDSAAAAHSIAPHLHPDATVVSLQNCLRNPDRLRAALPRQRVVAGLVSFNIVWDADPAGRARFRQATTGPLALQAGGAPDLERLLRQAGLPIACPVDLVPVQWAKLLFNLNNAINALSGLSLAQELGQRGYRQVLARAMTEGLDVLKAAGQPLVALGRMRPRLAPRVLPLPDALFRLMAAPMLQVDPAARSSMADDLSRWRPTEIADINCEVVALGRSTGVPTPQNERLVHLIEDAEAAGAGCPGLPPEALRVG